MMLCCKYGGLMDYSFLVELFGYLASAIIAVSIMLKTFIRLRIVNMIGAFLLVIYGLVIKAYPVSALNFFIGLVNLYFIIQYYKQKEFFRLLEFQKNSAYLKEFIQFYHKDIINYFPEFYNHYNEDLNCFYILRNMIPACVFIIKINDDKSAEILLDYVIPEYRDSKIGNFIFNQNAQLFKQMGIEKFNIKNPNLKHLFYLISVGFKSSEDDTNTYYKILSEQW